MSTKQKTVKEAITIKGKGLHTGVKVTMNIKPAPENSGFRFQRTDIEEKPIIDANVTNVENTARGTVIKNSEASVSTIEHLMAAFMGLDLDNAFIEIDGPEAPILDGSSAPFMSAIKKGGIVTQDAEREFIEIKDIINYKSPDGNTELVALPYNGYSLDVMISFDSAVLDNQHASLDNLANFESEIAPCRTFVFVRELEPLLKHNLVKGGDLDNAIVIMDQEVSQQELDRIADLFEHDHVKVNSIGILNNVELIFNNECARHKLLDVVGDLALTGKYIKGKIIAKCPGHSSNVEFARLLAKQYKHTKAEGFPPDCDVNTEPLMDINKIKKLLPHRYPFLLVDKIMEIGANYCVGVKNVSLNEPFFNGHFPKEPVMPGVLIIEAMAQCGGVFIINSLPGEGYSTYIMKLDNIKFRKKVVPGDTIVFKLKLLSPLRRGIVNMKGYAFVGNSLVCEGEFMAQVIKTN